MFFSSTDPLKTKFSLAPIPSNTNFFKTRLFYGTDFHWQTKNHPPISLLLKCHWGENRKKFHQKFILKINDRKESIFNVFPNEKYQKLVEADWEWAEHYEHRWVIIAAGRYSFPVHRIRWNHAMVHFDKFYPVSFLFDTIFFLLELVVLMKFFCLRIFCHLTGILRSSAFFL